MAKPAAAPTPSGTLNAISAKYADYEAHCQKLGIKVSLVFGAGAGKVALLHSSIRVRGWRSFSEDLKDGPYFACHSLLIFGGAVQQPPCC